MRERSGIVTTAAAALLSTLLIPVAAVAQGTLSVEAEDVECLPIANNGVAWTTVRNNVPDTTVRLNFRRMHAGIFSGSRERRPIWGLS